MIIYNDTDLSIKITNVKELFMEEGDSHTISFQINARK
jgi:hypothetical protein